MAKRAFKLIKKKLGTMKRAKVFENKISNFVQNKIKINEQEKA